MLPAEVYHVGDRAVEVRRVIDHPVEIAPCGRGGEPSHC